MDDIVTWSDERIEQLRRLWDQGLSASVIGKQLGVSKNAVVGKAHRLKLPARPSPIRKGTRQPVRRMAVLAKPLTPALAPAATAPLAGSPAVAGEPPVAGMPAAGVARAVEALAPLAPPLRAPRPAASVAAPLAAAIERALPAMTPAAEPRGFAGVAAPRKTAARGAKSCLWPIGDPGAADFHFCGAEAVPGKSYCTEHCAKAYITKSHRDPKAA